MYFDCEIEIKINQILAIIHFFFFFLQKAMYLILTIGSFPPLSDWDRFPCVD